MFTFEIYYCIYGNLTIRNFWFTRFARKSPSSTRSNLSFSHENDKLFTVCSSYSPGWSERCKTWMPFLRLSSARRTRTWTPRTSVLSGEECEAAPHPASYCQGSLPPFPKNEHFGYRFWFHVTSHPKHVLVSWTFSRGRARTWRAERIRVTVLAVVSPGTSRHARRWTRLWCKRAHPSHCMLQVGPWSLLVCYYGGCLGEARQRRSLSPTLFSARRTESACFARTCVVT